jgi:hypothetical protein
MPDRYSLPNAIGWSIPIDVHTHHLASPHAFGIAMLIDGTVNGAVAWLESAGPGPILLQSAVALAATGLFTWLIGMRALGLTLGDLRYAVAHRGAGFLIGGLAGGLAGGVTLAIAALAGGAEWTPDQGTPLD